MWTNRGRSGVLIALMVLGLYPALAVGAADQALEKGWAQLIQGRLREGQPVWLKTADNPKVFAIYEGARRGSPRGGVILLHDMGQHPDWPRVIRPLRTALPRHGWATLAVQMPVLAPDQSMDQYGPLVTEAGARLQAAVAYLKSQGISSVMLAGYGLGATMGAAYLAAHADAGIRGFIGISMGTIGGGTPALDTSSYLSRVHLPMLAVYGSRDYEWVLRSIPRLAAAARRARAAPPGASPAPAAPQGGGPGHDGGNSAGLRQEEIMGADHDYTGTTDLLTRDVLGWMNRLAGGGAG